MVIDHLLHWQDLLVTTYCTDKAWHGIPETRYHSALPKASLLSHQMVPTLPSGHFESKMIVLNVKNLYCRQSLCFIYLYSDNLSILLHVKAQIQ